MEEWKSGAWKNGKLEGWNSEAPNIARGESKTLGNFLILLPHGSPFSTVTARGTPNFMVTKKFIAPRQSRFDLQ